MRESTAEKSRNAARLLTMSLDCSILAWLRYSYVELASMSGSSHPEPAMRICRLRQAAYTIDPELKTQEERV